MTSTLLSVLLWCTLTRAQSPACGVVETHWCGRQAGRVYTQVPGVWWAWNRREHRARVERAVAERCWRGMKWWPEEGR
jgi:hypothetical protein